MKSGNYSILNCYNYPNKPAVHTALDWLSAPCRCALGGRKVSLFERPHDDKKLVIERAAAIVFSLFIFPIGLLSTVCLGLKAATNPWRWEKHKVLQLYSEEEKSFLPGTKAASGQSRAIVPEKAAAATDQTEACDRESIQTKINRDPPREQLRRQPSTLSARNTAVLVVAAVKKQLANEVENNTLTLDMAQIRALVTEGLAGKSRKQIIACYTNILTDVLQIDQEDELFLCAIKLDLAAQIIAELRELDHSADLRILQEEETKLWDKIFEGSRKDSSFSDIINSKQSLEQIHTELQKLRLLTDMAKNMASTLNEIKSAGLDLKAKCHKIKAVIQSQQAEFNQTFQDDGEFIECTNFLYDDFIDFADVFSHQIAHNDIYQSFGKIFPAILNDFSRLQQATLTPKKPTSDITSFLLLDIIRERRNIVWESALSFIYTFLLDECYNELIPHTF